MNTQKKVKLDPELRKHLKPNKVLGRILRHPLVFCVPYHKELNDYCNRSLEQKSLAVAEAIRVKKWWKVIALHERPFRIDAFIRYMDKMTDRQYWDSLAYVWTDSEGPGINRDTWISLFEWPRQGRDKHVMDKDERATFKRLPDELVVYRGCSVGEVKPVQARMQGDVVQFIREGARRAGKRSEWGASVNKVGISWSLDVTVAQWFANRFKREGAVLRAIVSKKDVYAYFMGRREQEIVANPVHFKEIKLWL